MTPEEFKKKASRYPTKSCEQCGIRMSPRVFVDSRTGWEGLEQLSKFTGRKFCSVDCFSDSRRTAGDEHVVKSPHVRRALAEWRAAHGLEWPYQGPEWAQDHYLALLDEYRGAA